MLRNNVVLAVLNRLETENRRLKRVLAAVLTLFVVLICTAMVWQDSVERKFYLDYSSGAQRTNMEVSKKEAILNPQSKKSIVLYRPGASEITAKFQAPRKPNVAVLEIEHLSSGAQVKFGGTTRITIIINGHPLVKDWEVGSHGHATDRLHISKLLREGENTVQIRLVSGRTTYWMKRPSTTASTKRYFRQF